MNKKYKTSHKALSLATRDILKGVKCHTKIEHYHLLVEYEALRCATNKITLNEAIKLVKKGCL